MGLQVILGLGWSYQCDLWSAGCILVELITGRALFQTHENLEHLAMIERVVHPFPADMVKRASKDAQSYFHVQRRDLLWETTASRKSIKAVQQLAPLKRLLKLEADPSVMPHLDPLHALLADMLSLAPGRRSTARECLQHPFFRENIRSLLPKQNNASSRRQSGRGASAASAGRASAAPSRASAGPSAATASGIGAVAPVGARASRGAVAREDVEDNDVQIVAVRSAAAEAEDAAAPMAAEAIAPAPAAMLPLPPPPGVAAAPIEPRQTDAAPQPESAPAIHQHAPAGILANSRAENGGTVYAAPGQSATQQEGQKTGRSSGNASGTSTADAVSHKAPPVATRSSARVALRAQRARQDEGAEMPSEVQGVPLLASNLTKLAGGAGSRGKLVSDDVAPSDMAEEVPWDLARA